MKHDKSHKTGEYILHDMRISTLSHQSFWGNIENTNKRVNRDTKHEISQELNCHHTSISTSHKKGNSRLIEFSGVVNKADISAILFSLKHRS